MPHKREEQQINKTKTTNQTKQTGRQRRTSCVCKYLGEQAYKATTIRIQHQHVCPASIGLWVICKTHILLYCFLTAQTFHLQNTTRSRNRFAKQITAGLISVADMYQQEDATESGHFPICHCSRNLKSHWLFHHGLKGLRFGWNVGNCETYSEKSSFVPLCSPGTVTGWEEVLLVQIMSFPVCLAQIFQCLYQSNDICS